MAHSIRDKLVDLVRRWPVVRQAAGQSDRSDAAVSDETRRIRARIAESRAVPSVCPYCAVGCGTLIHVKDGRILDIEGDPRSPISEGTLCPKGADIYQYTVNPRRLTTTLYRRPGGTAWEQVPLEWAMERITRLVKETRDRTFREADERGRPLRHTDGLGFLGGAALDNEENYLIKKLCVGLGVVSVENQARI